jgi:hypothetical protein
MSFANHIDHPAIGRRTIQLGTNKGRGTIVDVQSNVFGVATGIVKWDDYYLVDRVPVAQLTIYRR